MHTNQPRLIQTYLPDGHLEGPKIIELSESSIKVLVIPRLQLSKVKDRQELLHPALYLLISNSEQVCYIGESENFFYRVKNHDQHKEFWDIAIAIISPTNTLEKSDVKYLESLAVTRAHSGSMEILNKTTPAKNNIHEFKLHSLQRILDDTHLILTSLGYDILSRPKKTESDVWYCTSKKTQAKAQFRGDKFVMLTGSKIDTSYTQHWASHWPKSLIEREEIFKKYGNNNGEIVELYENVAFKSPNHAGGFATGHNINAWVTWKDKNGVTMDEIMRKTGTKSR